MERYHEAMTRIFPNLFIPGAAKSGTSSLHDLLNYHPDVCMSAVKEPVFWNSEGHTIPKRIEWYNDLFIDPDAKILGESTTSYMYYPEFITSVKTHFEEVPKFIFILRNPIDRCFSHYWYLKGRGQEKRDFREALESDLNRPFESYGYLPNYYYHFGLYGKWLKRFYDAFGDSQIKIITLDQLIENRLDTINGCFSFLGLPTLKELPDIKVNTAAKLKYPRLFHFINKSASGKYRYTKIAKYLMSRKRIDTIKQRLKKLPYFKGSVDLSYPELSEKDRLWLKTIYKDDVSLLKQITQKEFLEWTDFNT